MDLETSNIALKYFRENDKVHKTVLACHMYVAQVVFWAKIKWSKISWHCP